MSVVDDQRYKNYLFKEKTIRLYADMTEVSRNTKRKRDGEISREVPMGWTEGKEGNEKSWSLPYNQSYEGPEGGGEYGPSFTLKYHLGSKKPGTFDWLAQLFLFFVPMSLLQHISDCSNSYGNGEWVKAVKRNNVYKTGKTVTLHDTLNLTVHKLHPVHARKTYQARSKGILPLLCNNGGPT